MTSGASSKRLLFNQHCHLKTCNETPIAANYCLGRDFLASRMKSLRNYLCVFQRECWVFLPFNYERKCDQSCIIIMDAFCWMHIDCYCLCWSSAMKHRLTMAWLNKDSPVIIIFTTNWPPEKNNQYILPLWIRPLSHPTGTSCRYFVIVYVHFLYSLL